LLHSSRNANTQAILWRYMRPRSDSEISSSARIPIRCRADGIPSSRSFPAAGVERSTNCFSAVF